LVWLALSWLTAAGAWAQLRVTYIANEGFLLAGEGKKVLVDSLFANGVSGYATLPGPMRSASRAAEDPFDGVDLILVSHFHADHFDAATVVEHLRASSETVFLSTPQAVYEIQKLVEDDKGILDRLTAVHPPEGESLSLKRAGIELEVLNLHHGRGGNPPVENLGFVVRMGGVTWLHVGDTEATLSDFRPYSLPEKAIDVALLPDWFLDYAQFVEVVSKEIQPRFVVVMHLATASAPASYFGKHANRSQRLEAIREGFPDAVVLIEAGASREFSSRR
jgi:L-ascorbate metabolism protein UlaG (beta-lactamase superfamily)